MSWGIEKWVPVAPNDIVHDVGYSAGGQVVLHRDPNRGLFGSIVRYKEGVWQKRLLPLEIMPLLNPANIPQVRGRELPKGGR